MIFISFCWQPKMTVDFLICKWHCGRTLFTITETFFLSKNMKYLYIFGPEVSAKTMIDRFYFLTNLQSKIWKFHENWLKRFWENVSGKKKMIIEEKKHSSNKKIFRWTWKTFINLAWSTSLSTSITV